MQGIFRQLEAVITRIDISRLSYELSNLTAASCDLWYNCDQSMSTRYNDSDFISQEQCSSNITHIRPI